MNKAGPENVHLSDCNALDMNKKRERENAHGPINRKNGCFTLQREAFFSNFQLV